MQNKHDGLLRAVNSSKVYNILTFPTHESYQSNWRSMKSTFYLFQGPNINKWNLKYRKLPENHILLDGSDDQIKLDLTFDAILCQNRWGQYPVAKRLSQELNLPIIFLEHTAPYVGWSELEIAAYRQIRGVKNVFISHWSVGKWGWNIEDSTVRIIRHGVDTELFNNNDATHDDGKILTVMNDAINRKWALGTDLYFRVTEGLPTNPVGATPGLSEAAKNTEDLVNKCKSASLFFNSSSMSPLPMSLLENAMCATPIVTTKTCAIPETFIDGENCWMSNDENVLRDRLEWCLKNPDEARKMGLEAQKMALKYFSLDRHISEWENIFAESIDYGN